jgi:hypothetical protein
LRGFVGFSSILNSREKRVFYISLSLYMGTPKSAHNIFPLICFWYLCKKTTTMNKKMEETTTGIQKFAAASKMKKQMKKTKMIANAIMMSDYMDMGMKMKKK